MSTRRTTSVTPWPKQPEAGRELGPLVGQTLAGYELVSYIGEGPTGVVYRANDLLGKRLAVKVMHIELGRRAEAESLRDDLGRIAEKTLHHFVPLTDGGFGPEGQLYLVTSELSGCDLEAGLRESGGLASERAFEILRQICFALEELHLEGLVHGGLKPTNVFLCPEDEMLSVKLLDAGAYRLAKGLTDMVVGNPFYMAPEQLNGVADARTDVYAVGVLMYQLVTGSLPFSGGHGEAMMQHLAELPAPPVGADPELARIILKALAKDPAERYQTVHALREDLDHWISANARFRSHTFNRDFPDDQVPQDQVEVTMLPDATRPMNKKDLAELAMSTPEDMPTTPGQGAPNTANNPKAEESVEASLEEFISQANATFPATTDGWDLHTGDVEFVESEEPAQARPQFESRPVINNYVTPAMAPAPVPAQVQVPWLRIIIGLTGAFILGAVVVVLLVRTLLPASQPVVIQGPPPTAVAAPAPVVTPLPGIVIQPSQPVAAPAPVAQPVVAQPAAVPAPSAPAAAAAPAAQPAAAPAVQPAPPAPIAPAAAAPAPAPEPRAPKAAAPKKQVTKKAVKAEEIPTAKAAPSKPAKEKKETKKGGSDWVDPF